MDESQCMVSLVSIFHMVLVLIPYSYSSQRLECTLLITMTPFSLPDRLPLDSHPAPALVQTLQPYDFHRSTTYRRSTKPAYVDMYSPSIELQSLVCVPAN